MLTQSLTSLAAPPRGSGHCQLAVGLETDPHLQLFDAASGAFVQSLRGHRDSVWSVRWSPRCPFLLFSGGRDGTLRIWDVRRAGPLLALDAGGGCGRAHEGPITAVEPSADGLHLLSSGGDGRMRLWDVAAGRHQLVHYAGTANASGKGNRLGATPDGRTVFHPTGRVVQAFDVHAGALRATLRGHFAAVTACVFHPTLQELYTAGHDGNVLVWDGWGPVPPDECDGGARGGGGGHSNADAWSDGDEPVGGPRLLYR